VANPLLIADCPRCGASAITFDVTAHVFRKQEYGWLNWHEVFSVCRNCHSPSIFLIKMTLIGRENARENSEEISRTPAAIMSVKISLNNLS